MIRRSDPGSAANLQQRLLQVRHHSLELVAPLEPEDLVLQGMADASPPKWHLAHTTWFFETFLLVPHRPGWRPQAEPWPTLFNSYYQAAGPRHPRPDRGLLSRPPIAEVLAWRQRVDQELERWLEEQPPLPIQRLLELGLQHEQQHQELLLMDLLDAFSRNPMAPVYSASAPQASVAEAEPSWLALEGGLVSIGHHSNNPSFHFDNEAPAQRVWLEPYDLANQLVSNGDYANFIADGGYQTPALWMAEGWDLVQQQGWQAPLYWLAEAGEFSLRGLGERDPRAPVGHISWFEADAYARWAGARLPTEAEWEWAVNSGEANNSSAEQWFGSRWQWTASAYGPYRGFQPSAGAIGEYNGKFMSSQMVLRGSSAFTPAGHGRSSYRNFFAPHCRWLNGGLRLAKDRP